MQLSPELARIAIALKLVLCDATRLGLCVYVHVCVCDSGLRGRCMCKCDDLTWSRTADNEIIQVKLRYSGNTRGTYMLHRACSFPAAVQKSFVHLGRVSIGCSCVYEYLDVHNTQTHIRIDQPCR